MCDENISELLLCQQQGTKGQPPLAGLPVPVFMYQLTVKLNVVFADGLVASELLMV
jgi:hypothetical protein